MNCARMICNMKDHRSYESNNGTHAVAKIKPEKIPLKLLPFWYPLMHGIE